MDSATTKIRATQSIAPEDLRVGDFVALLQVSYELPSFLWGRDATLDTGQPVRLTFLPHRDIGRPLEVMAICLPFVIVQCLKKKQLTIDLRASRLGRLDEEFVRIARPAEKKKKKSRSSKT